MKKITLVLGGIRSGKSVFAETKAKYYSAAPQYIATAIPFDEEMKARIAIHQARRDHSFVCHEVPYDIIPVLSKMKNETVLVDCMTLNLSNRLLQFGDKLNLDTAIADDTAYLNKILEVITDNQLNVIFVSNEVGSSPVAKNKLKRYFQDLQGRWNRILAENADEVYSIQAGIATQIKKNSLFPFRISAPSYVIPGGYIENINYLMDKVSNIQLLLFDSADHDPLFKEDTLQTLRYQAQGAGINYSVHMPSMPELFKKPKPTLAKCIKIIEKLNELPVETFTFHFDLPAGQIWSSLNESEQKSIHQVYIQLFQAITKEYPTINMSLENTVTPLSALDPVILDLKMYYCIDVGHLLMQGLSLKEVVSRLKYATAVHVHDIDIINDEKKDHQPVKFNPTLFTLLESFKKILTIENYHKLHFEKSLRILSEYF
jgi:adenosylcobinamide kinase/adenosylcobinamide-phosphate guanylyltransferase